MKPRSILHIDKVSSHDFIEDKTAEWHNNKSELSVVTSNDHGLLVISVILNHLKITRAGLFFEYFPGMFIKKIGHNIKNKFSSNKTR